MKLKDKISWLMGSVQRSLFPHLDDCLELPLTEQEKRLVTILEIVQVEKRVPKSASTQWLGRKSLEREALARSFVAKALYRHPTTRDLIRALESAESLRRLCGFMTLGDVPSESTFSRAFAEFATSDLGNRVHGDLVNDYFSGELIGHISRDATAITGREKPAKKFKEPKKPAKRGRPAKDEHREAVPEKRLDRQVSQSAEEAISELPTSYERQGIQNQLERLQAASGHNRYRLADKCPCHLGFITRQSGRHTAHKTDQRQGDLSLRSDGRRI
jgi:transposase